MTLNSQQFSCLSLPNDSLTGIHPHAQPWHSLDICSHLCRGWARRLFGTSLQPLPHFLLLTEDSVVALTISVLSPRVPWLRLLGNVCFFCPLNSGHSENSPPFFSSHPFYHLHFLLLYPFGFFLFLPFLQGTRWGPWNWQCLYVCRGSWERVGPAYY